MKFYIFKLLNIIFGQEKSTKRPDCFGEYLGGNIQAERCCDDCPELTKCMARLK